MGTRLQAEGDGEVSFPDVGRAEEQDVVAALEITAGGQFANDFRIDGRLELEVERVQGLLEREARHRHAHRQRMT